MKKEKKEKRFIVMAGTSWYRRQFAGTAWVVCPTTDIPQMWLLHDENTTSNLANDCHI